MPIEKLAALDSGVSSEHVRSQVEAARRIQAERFATWEKQPIRVNGDMGPAEVQAFCTLPEEGHTLMKAAAQQLNLSARAYHRVLKLARTIADLASAEQIQIPHLAEALQYRPREIL